MKTTIEEIARLAGVSKATVSRVMNNSEKGVGKETRKRVQDIIDSVGYVHTVSISKSDMHSIGRIALILPDMTNPFFMDIAKAIESKLQNAGYMLVLVNTNFSKELEKSAILNLIASKVSGIILITSFEHECPEHQWPLKYGIPMVLLDRIFPNSQKWNSVTVDNTYAVYNACRLLISHGSNRIVYLGAGGENDKESLVSTALERLEGYQIALRENNIEYSSELLTYGHYTIEGGYDSVMRLARAGVDYTSIMATNDLMAYGAVQALIELGHKVPDDIEVIGCDNIMFSRYCDPPLTTIQQPTIEMGEKSADMVLSMIDNEMISKHIKLQSRLVRRKSTRDKERWDG